MSENKDNEADPFSEGFVSPPRQITEPCRMYIARIMELRKFVSFYFTFVKTSREFTRLIRKECGDNCGERFFVTKYNYSDQRPLMNELMLSRAIESFDFYLTTIFGTSFCPGPKC